MTRGTLNYAPFERLFPRQTASSISRIRAAGETLDSSRPEEDPAIWEWMAAHATYPGAPTPGTPVVLYRAMSVEDRDGDWAEVELDVSWARNAGYEVAAQLGIACHCDTDHGTHYVQRFTSVAADFSDLAELFEAAVQTALALIAGPTDPTYWREVEGLP